MSTFYDTRNPIPSNDPRDLDDNAKHIDAFANSANATEPDRFGVQRKTIAGIVNDADAELLRTQLAAEDGAELVGAGVRTQAEKNADVLSVRDLSKDAGMPVATDDIDAIRAASLGGDGFLPEGVYPVSGFVNNNLDQKVHILGKGRSSIIRKNASTSTAIVASRDSSDTSIRSVTIDLTDGNSTTVGHAISLIDCNGAAVKDVEIIGFTGLGSGLLSYTASESDQVSLQRVKDSKFVGDRNLSPNTNGFLITGGRTCWMQGLYAKGAGAYAIEYKNKGTYSFMLDSFTEDSVTGFAYGQTTVGDTGVSYSIVSALISYNNSTAFAVGKGKHNLSANCLVHIDADTAFPGRAGIRSDGTAGNNSYPNWLFAGLVNEPVRFGASSNYVSGAFYNTTSSVAIFTAGATRNVVEVQHPGSRNTILAGITDNSGSVPGGPSGNVVFCAATGESRGSLSGRHRHQLAASGIAPTSSSQKFVVESTGDTFFTSLTDGTGVGGLASVSPSGTATVSHNAASDFWQMSGHTGGWFVRIANNIIRFGNDALASIGSTANRFLNVYSVNFRPGAGTVTWTSGAGTPEGTVTAVVGSMYTRTDGGANTTLYIKESGAGNTGWVAK